MLLKAATITLLTAATTLRLDNDTSIADTNLQQPITVGQLQKIVNQLTKNNIALKSRINRIGVVKVKLLLIKRFLGERLKLKGFLTQMHFKIAQEGAKLAIPID